MRVGVNVAGGRTYYDPLIYRDIMRQADRFASDYGSPRGQKLPDLRPDGYPVGVTGPATPGSLVIEAPLPAGRYSIAMAGRGRIMIGWGTWRTVDADGSGSTTVLDLPAVSQVVIIVKASDPADPIRDITIVDEGGSGVFRPQAIADLSGFAVHRHLDTRAVNADPAVDWPDQPASGLNSLWRGVPFEDLCDLANQCGADPWFCIPFHASDAYIEAMARTIDARLAPGRKVYVEFSNELWNYNFEQGQAVLAIQKATTPAVDRQVIIGRKSAAAINRFRSALSPSRKCVRVVSGQAGWIDDSKTACLTAMDSGGADAIACAPYFGYVDSKLKPAVVALGARWAKGDVAALDELFGVLQFSIDVACGWARKWRDLAGKLGVPLYLYECGQGLDDPADASLVSLYIAANRDARMGAAYTAYFDGLRDAGVDLACHYVSHRTPTKWGSWGLREYVGQPDSEAHKARALRAWIAANPQPPALTLLASIDVLVDASGAITARVKPTDDP